MESIEAGLSKTSESTPAVNEVAEAQVKAATLPPPEITAVPIFEQELKPAPVHFCKVKVIVPLAADAISKRELVQPAGMVTESGNGCCINDCDPPIMPT